LASCLDLESSRLQVLDCRSSVDVIGYAVAPGAFPWFNFWWARAPFLKKLPAPLVSTNRWYYEDYIGRFGGCTAWTDQCSPGEM